MTNHFAGIDVGASTTKCVIINNSKKIISRYITKSGADFKKSSEISFQKSLKIAKISKKDIPTTQSEKNLLIDIIDIIPGYIENEIYITCGETIEDFEGIEVYNNQVAEMILEITINN